MGAIKTFIELQQAMVRRTQSLLACQQEILETLQDGGEGLDAMLPILEGIARRHGSKDPEGPRATRAGVSPRPHITGPLRGDSTDSASRLEKQPEMSRRETGLNVEPLS